MINILLVTYVTTEYIFGQPVIHLAKVAILLSIYDVNVGRRKFIFWT